MAFLSLEQAVYRRLKTQGFSGQHVFLACSGGLDSMVLVECFRRLQKVLKLRLSVVHIHHGQAINVQLLAFRDSARSIVKGYCVQNHLHYITNKTNPKSVLKSEAEFRQFRKACFNTCLRNYPGARLFTAHHLDDLLETRLLQLIRGSGLAGLAHAHGYSDRQLLPLAEFTKKELKAYALRRELDWLEDPSNAEEDAMRNWLRHHWLGELKKKDAGALRRLGLSLEKISTYAVKEQNRSKKFFDRVLGPEGQIQRDDYNLLSPSEKLSFLNWYFRKKGLRAYTANHIQEVCKRLDSPQKNFSFRLLKSLWSVDQRHVSISNS